LASRADLGTGARRCFVFVVRPREAWLVFDALAPPGCGAFATVPAVGIDFWRATKGLMGGANVGALVETE
jgi:hypothetical protein